MNRDEPVVVRLHFSISHYLDGGGPFCNLLDGRAAIIHVCWKCRTKSGSLPVVTEGEIWTWMSTEKVCAIVFDCCDLCHPCIPVVQVSLKGFYINTGKVCPIDW